MILLVRHGESTLNALGIKYGRLNPGLTERGIEQAHRVALHLDGCVVQVVTSPLRRAHDFATIVAHLISAPTPIVIPDLMERAFGAAEGMTPGMIRRLWPDGDVPGMETYQDAAARARTALEPITAPTAVITHAGVIRGLLTLDRSPSNAEVIEYAPRRHRTPLPTGTR